MENNLKTIVETIGCYLGQQYNEHLSFLLKEYDNKTTSNNQDRLIHADYLLICINLVKSKLDILGSRLQLLLGSFQHYHSEINNDEIISKLQEMSLNNSFITQSFKKEHWSLLKKITFDRHYQKTEDIDLKNNASISMRLQLRLSKAFQSETPLLNAYLSHPCSPEGQNIRDFAKKMLNITDINEAKKIPEFLRQQESTLSKRIKEKSAMPQAQAPTSISPADSLRHTAEGEAALFQKLCDPGSTTIPEFIDYAMEAYFYSLVGGHIFGMFIEKETDDIISERCRYFSNSSPEQFGVSPKLVRSGRPLFTKTVDLLRAFSSRSSPISKLIAAYQAIESLLLEIKEQTGHMAGVDDFTEPLMYCCFVANIDKAMSQIRFISEMSRKRIQKTAFWAHFITLQVVIEHISLIQIDEEMDEAMNSSRNLQDLISLTKSKILTKRANQNKQHVSTFSLEDEMSDLPLSAEAFREKPFGITSISDPISVSGFKAFVVPSWAIRQDEKVSVLVVKTGNPEDKVVMRNIAFSEDSFGVRQALKIAHPQGIELEPMQTIEGIVNATKLELVPPEMATKLIPIKSGNLSEEISEIEIKVYFMMIDDLPGNATLEEHHSEVEIAYDIHNSTHMELIHEVTHKACTILKIFGFISLNHQENFVDHITLNAISMFTHKFIDEECSQIDRLTPSLLQSMTYIMNEWGNSLCRPFNPILSRNLTNETLLPIIIGIIQFYKGYRISCVLDTKTLRAAKKIVYFSQNMPQLSVNSFEPFSLADRQ